MRLPFRPRTERSPGALARRVSRRLDAGDTLVEVLIALTVLGTASVALLIAFGTTLSASAQHRSLSNYNTVLASTNSEVSSLVQQNAGSIFGTCAPLSAYPSTTALSAYLPSPFTAQITSVAYWNGTSFTSTCSSSDNTAPQMITVTVTNSTTHRTYQIQVVVDNPSTISVAAGSNLPAYQLVFITQPSGATYNAPFAAQPVVEVEDKNGHLVDSDLSPVTITLTSGPNGAVLSNCTGIESSGYITYTGCSINQLGVGYQLTASEPSGSKVIPAVSAPFDVTATQLDTPSITNVLPSTTTAGAINVTFTGSSNAPSGQTYTVKACTDSAMSAGCVSQANFTSGSDLDFLIAGRSYYVSVNATGSTYYLPATTPASGPTPATIQLNAPSAVTVTPSTTTAGALTVTFTASSNAAAGQTYTALACTAPNMGSGCDTASAITSGGQIVGLVGGTPYYVTVTASASSGYLISPASAISGPAPATIQLNAPSAVSVTQSGSQNLRVTFTASSNAAGGQTYTVKACTASNMGSGCITTSPFTSGNLTNTLASNTQYWVTVTASASSGYLAGTSNIIGPTTS